MSPDADFHLRASLSAAGAQPRFDMSLWVCSPLTVPDIQPLPPPHRFRAGEGQSRQEAQDLAPRVCPQLAPRGRDDLTEDDEPALTTQRPAHRRLFRSEQPLIEATSRVEGLAGTEQEAPAGQPQGSVEGQ